MEQRKDKSRGFARTADAVHLLEGYYDQLLKWGAVLTRGDAGMTEEIVQELCLHFTLTKPDLSSVINLDGYLYTCLRHIYLSGLARASRESQHFISIAEFDFFESAVAAHQLGEPLQRQNDLRRICGYMIWRKQSSKTASYFILHFFHGYARQEIADLACLPVSAVYNKLKIARTEAKSYLQDPGKLRLVNRESPPQPVLSRNSLSFAELFQELRDLILSARISDCLPEKALLEHYLLAVPKPISCSLLAHIVSCERCLEIVDSHFRRPTLRDRDPFNERNSSTDGNNEEVSGRPNADQASSLQSVHRRGSRIREHYPRVLSIAVNGHIIAFHDVQAARSKLSARVEHPERAQFVEVFSEQDVRLALLPVTQTPPEGAHILTQHVALSGDRWLELNLTFDGLGLGSEVSYFDPALEIGMDEDDSDEPLAALQSKPKSPVLPLELQVWPKEIYAAFARTLRMLMPSSAVVWAVVLALIFSTAGYLAYRHRTANLNAREIVSESLRMETTALEGQTEHQVLRIEEVAADEKLLRQGTVDLWKDGDGKRYLRRLYDSQHRMVEAKWRNESGEHTSRRKEGGKHGSAGSLPLADRSLWDQGLSVRTFTAIGASEAKVRAYEHGYELTVAGPTKAYPQLVSATLVLDHSLTPVRETMRLRVDGEIHELRLLQTSYERRPSASVPDAIFDPFEEHPHSATDQGLRRQDTLQNRTTDEVRLAELQIAVLYRLSSLGSDTGQPIEVVRANDGRIRVSGTIADNALKHRIISQLQTLEDHQLLDLRLTSPGDVHIAASGTRRTFSGDTSVYDVHQTKSPADAALRRYFRAKGLSGERLDSATAQFSRDALQHAQHALQHASALARLGSALSAAELKSINLSSQQQWTEMVRKHASELGDELHTLHGQLVEIVPTEPHRPDATGPSTRIEDPVQFEQEASQLLRQVQDLNRDIDDAFTSDVSGEGQSDHDKLLPVALSAIPLQRTEEITSFAIRLSDSVKGTSVNRENSQDKTTTPHRAR